MTYICVQQSVLKMGSGQLIKISNCTCLEDIITYNCVITGSGFTVWQGNAFDCSAQNNKTLLRHTLFGGSGTMKQCNGGAIVGRSLGVSGDIYTSELNVTASSDLIGRTVECAYSPNGITVTPVNSTTIGLTG